MENFDDLFDDFINRNNDTPKKGNKKSGNFDINNLPDDMPESIKNLITAIIGGLNDENSEPDLDLGIPNDSETINDGDSTFEKKTWETDFGSITRISVSGPLDDESINSMLENLKGKKPKTVKELSLEEQLQIAEAKENYEECAILRDKIKAKKKKTKTKITD